MKKHFLLLTLMISSYHSFSQAKDDIILGGGVNIVLDKDATGRTNNSFYINPGAGYFFNEHWGAGLFMSYNTRTSQDTGALDLKYVNTETGFGPWLRYTQTLSNIFFIFGQLDLAYNSGIASVGSIKVPMTRTTGMSANLYPVVGINVHKGFALNIGIGGVGYVSSKSASDVNSSGRFTFNFGKTLQIGVSKFFNTSKKAEPPTQ